MSDSRETLVVHFHEVGLKGHNRDFFEDALARNLKRALRGTGYDRLRRGFGRIMIDLAEGADADVAAERAARVFGVAYVGRGRRVEPSLDEIRAVALDLMTATPIGRFAVRARRTYSSFDMKSNDINVAIGQAIVDATGAKVDLSNPDTTLVIELFGGTGIVYRERSPGAGGLPVGTSARMIALLSGGIDSPVAAWRMARRGAEVELLHFHGQPFSDPSSVRQAGDLAEALAAYQLRVLLHLVPLGNIQREIVMNCPSNLRIVLYRRMMMRIASAFAKEREAAALITGDALGQVASQTIENIRTVSAAADVQVFRPLIGMDKQEIIDTAKHIGTYEISTRRYQDCCVLFEPRDPATRANDALANRAEERLDLDALIGKALTEIETRVVELPPPRRPT